MKTLKYNFLMGIIRLVTGVLFPIIIMPHINKCFQPSLIGEIEYVNTIVNYFILVAALGIPIYGVREVSKNKKYKFKLKKIMLELLIILIVTNVLSYAVYFILVYFIRLNINKILFIIIGTNIFFSTIGVEWFYQGIEDQRYITIRAVIVRMLSGIAIFTLINEEKDYLKYAIILTIGVVGNNVFNLINLKKYFKNTKKVFKILRPQKHLKKLMITFIAGIATSIYTQMDIIMIGNIVGMEYVGLYNMPMKFIRLSTVIIVLFGSTFLPRVSNLWITNKEEYKKYIEKGFNILMLYSIFGSICLFLFAKDIICIFGGYKYYLSEITLKLLSPITMLSGIAYYTGVIILYSKGKDKIFLKAVIVAATTNLILNYIFIPKFNQNGAAIATIISELMVSIFIFIWAKKEMLEIKIFNRNIGKIFIMAIVIILLESVTQIKVSDGIVQLLEKVLVVLFIYTTGLYLLREENFFQLENIIKVNIKKLGSK